MFDNAYVHRFRNNNAPIVTYYRKKTRKEARYFTPLHYHDFFEILYICEGSASMIVNGAPFIAEKNSLILINPYETHYGEMLSDSLGYYCIVFDIKLLSLPNEADIIENKIKYTNHLPNSDSSRLHIDAVNAAYESQDSAWLLSAKGHLFLLFHMLADQLSESVSSNQAMFEKKVIDYIDANYMNGISSSDISAALGYNQNYFCRAFRKSFSCRFCDYLNSYRIRQAKELLKTNKVSAVSSMVGFSNINYFSVVFKNAAGISPSDYKKKLNLSESKTCL